MTRINGHVRSTGEKHTLAFCGSEVEPRHTRLGDHVTVSNARLDVDCQRTLAQSDRPAPQGTR